jgi:hypothetical protein
MRATGPRGVVVEEILLTGRRTLRVKIRDRLLGRGYYTTVPEALAALRRYGIDPADLVFDYTAPADAETEDPDCE